MVKKLIQKKTGKPLELTLHPIVVSILEQKRKEAEELQEPPSSYTLDQTRMAWEPSEQIFKLPTHNGANKSVEKWGHDAGQFHGLEDLALKDLTWHSARLTFSILLQDAGVDAATVALLLGHTTTKYVLETYKRHRPKNQLESLSKLPQAIWNTDKKFGRHIVDSISELQLPKAV